jgi:hypothetical protein
VVVRGDGNDGFDLWLKDLTTGVFSRLTSEAGRERFPTWSPDSRRVAYLNEVTGKRSLFVTLVGSGQHAAIPGSEQNRLEDWTRDGRQLVTYAGRVLSLLPAPEEGASQAGEGKPQTVFEEPYLVSQIRVSPDGRWVAYTSDESGQPQINVASFPAFTNRRQISSDTAVQPLWRSDGKELFFLGLLDRALMAVDVKSGATLETGPPRMLFQTPPLFRTPATYSYAATRDGQRFLLVEPAGSTKAAEPFYVVTNWTSLVGK